MRVQGVWLEMRSTSAKSGGRWRSGQLEAVQARQDVLVGHRGQAEARAAVADVAAVVDLVVVVEARPFRPRALVHRVVDHRPPAGALERPAQGEAVALDELVVAALGADPDPRLQGGVRQPAEPAEGRGGEEGAARREASRPQLCGALVEDGVDPRREGRALDRDPPVALDEQQQDVLAAQARQQPVAGSGAEAVAGDLAGEDLLGVQAAAHRLHLADGEGGGARGGDRRAEDAQAHPDDAQDGDGPEHPAAVAGRDAREAQQRQDRERRGARRGARRWRRRRGSRSTGRSRRAASRRRCPRSSSRRRGRTGGRRP